MGSRVGVGMLRKDVVAKMDDVQKVEDELYS
jgi:hypothetical protein